MSRSNNASYSKMHALALFCDTTFIDKLAKIYAIVSFHSMHTTPTWTYIFKVSFMVIDALIKLYGIDLLVKSWIHYCVLVCMWWLRETLLWCELWSPLSACITCFQPKLTLMKHIFRIVYSFFTNRKLEYLFHISLQHLKLLFCLTDRESGPWEN